MPCLYTHPQSHSQAVRLRHEGCRSGESGRHYFSLSVGFFTVYSRPFGV
jgi:hypothetical protein